MVKVVIEVAREQASTTLGSNVGRLWRSPTVGCASEEVNSGSVRFTASGTAPSAPTCRLRSILYSVSILEIGNENTSIHHQRFKPLLLAAHRLLTHHSDRKSLQNQPDQSTCCCGWQRPRSLTIIPDRHVGKSSKESESELSYGNQSQASTDQLCSFACSCVYRQQLTGQSAQTGHVRLITNRILTPEDLSCFGSKAFVAQGKPQSLPCKSRRKSRTLPSSMLSFCSLTTA